MGGFCLFVELNQEGSAPAAWAVGLFSLCIKNKYLCGSQKLSFRRTGLSKNQCFVLRWSFLAMAGLKPQNLRLGTQNISWPFCKCFFLFSDFLKCFQKSQRNLSEFYNKNSFCHFVPKCVRNINKKKWKKDTLEKKYALFLGFFW